jgi:signal transduction histidine kinase/ligand-binding sensor domain-containing protein
MKKIKGKAWEKIAMAFILFFLIYPPLAFSQWLNFEFDPLNAIPDITCRQTTAILEDSIGYLWIGTEEGLFRYDGQTVYSYLKEKNESKTLPSSQINSLVLDKDDNVWIGTSAGLCKYNREKDNFSVLPDKSDMNGFIDCNIKVLAFDNNGDLFVAYKESVYKYDRPNGRFSKVVELEVGRINSIVFDDRNNLWIGAAREGGLFCFDQKHKRTSSFYHNPKIKNSLSINDINVLAILGDTLWIGTSGRGMDALDLNTKTFTNYSFPKNLENYVNSIFIARNKKVWVCTYSCLKTFYPEGDTFINYYYDPRNPYSVEKSLTGFYEDSAGNFWTIHSTNGVRLARNNMKFTHFEANSGVFWATSEKIITALRYDFIDKYSRLWIGNYYNGVDIFDWKEHKTITLKHEESNPRSIAEGTIADLFLDSKQQMWVGATPGGLQRYNKNTNDFDSFRHHPNDTLTIARNDVRAIDEDSNGNLWLALQGEGVDRFNVRENIFYHYNPERNNLCNAWPNDVLVDSHDNVWVGTAQGLSFLPKGKSTFKNYLHNENDSNSLSNNEIHALYEDKHHDIWIATDNGLDKFEAKTQKFIHYYNGLKSKHVASIISDRNNDIWISTSAGISKLVKETGKFINYDQNYGLLSKEYIDRACMMDSVGTLFFGGARGFDTFNPKNLKMDTRQPKVVLTDFKLFNKSISCRTDSLIIDRHISYASNINLDYFQNAITFVFQAIALTDAQNIEYMYKLDGFDKDWVSAGKAKAASYTNLNPGNYTFRVKAKYENGEWGTNETTIGLKVYPAWWMTIGFKIIIILSLAAIIYIFVFIRTKRLHNQQERLTELVAERTREIESKKELLRQQAESLVEKNEQLNNLNATKDRLFSIISHDLRGPFNVILGFQNILVNEYAQCSEKERLDMVRKTYSTSQKVFNLVENLLNWARIQTSSIQYHPIPLDVKLTIIERLDLYRDIAEAKGINFNTELEDGLIAYADINILEAVLRNLIHNVIKFTPSGGFISVKAIQQNEAVLISVADSGVGMNLQQVESLFIPEKVVTINGTSGEKGSGLGLLLCKDFVEMNKGKITVVSKWGKGSTFSFTIPIFKEQHSVIEN